MDYEDIAHVNKSNFDEDITPSVSMQYIFHEIVFTLFAIIGICADAAIIYTIFRFKRMRKPENIFLANWAIADLCSLILTPSSYRILSVLDNLSLSAEFMCVITELGAILHVTVVFFVILVSIDWFISAYFPKASEKFRSYYKFVVGAVWILALLNCGITTGYCVEKSYTSLVGILLLGSFSTLLLTIIVCQSSRLVRKCSNKPLDHPTLKLTLTTSFVACWIGGFLIFLSVEFVGLHPVISVIAECALFGSSIVNLVLLYNFNTDFQACLLEALRRSNNKDDDKPVLSFNNPIIKNINKDSVQISFDDHKDELLTNMY